MPSPSNSMQNKLMPSPSSTQTLPGGCHRPEPEPVAPAIDSWARGRIPCRVPVYVSGAPPSPGTLEATEDPLLPVDRAQGSINNNTRWAADATGIEMSRLPHGGVSGVRGRGDGGDEAALGAEYEPGDGADGRVWGGGDEDGEEVGLTILPENEEVELAGGCCGIGDAVGRGRRQEERNFLEVWSNIIFFLRK